MVRHMKLILVLSLPLGVNYLMRCAHKALWGVLMNSLILHDHILAVYLVLARSARFDIRLPIPAGILRIPVFSAPVALFSQES